jgi:HlyD family secretion protein
MAGVRDHRHLTARKRQPLETVERHLTQRPKAAFLCADSSMSSPRTSLDDLRIERPARVESPSRFWPVVAALAVLLLLVAAAWWLRRPKPIPVHTALARETAGKGLEHTVLNASGYVTARRQATVSSKVTGKVIEVLIEEGMKVQEGQVLARLDDTNVRTSLKLAEAQLVSAKNSLTETEVRIKEAEQELQRQSDLIKNKIATQADFDHAEASALALKAHLNQQRADVTVAERQVAYWEQQLDDTIIRAPFTGIVTSKNAQPGEMISPVSAGGGFTRTGICTIVDMTSLEIEIDVNESYINRVEPGQPVEGALDAYPDYKMPCKVIAIIPTADRQKSTVKVRVGFDKLDPRILPEMGVKVGFRESAQSATAPVGTRMVTLPKGAVQQRDGNDVVMVVHNGRAELRAVRLSSTGTDEVLVSAGIVAGEKVVIDWPANLIDGAVIEEEQPLRNR